jgi:hypothetical protein
MSNLSNEQFKVYDFNAAKIVKARTGRAAAVQVSRTPDNPALTKHEDEAMAMGNPVVKKDNPLVKAGKFLGLYPE